MAKVSCALSAFEVDAGTLKSYRPHNIALEFLSRLDPALADEGCKVEVYRLHKLEEEDPLYEGDQLLCSIPSWNFDLNLLEDMFEEVEELKSKQEELLSNIDRAVSSLMTCGELIGSDAHTDSYVQGLKRLVSVRDAQIAEQKRKESKLRADLLWMRGQTEHLVQLVLDESAIVRSSKEQSSSTIQPVGAAGVTQRVVTTHCPV